MARDRSLDIEKYGKLLEKEKSDLQEQLRRLEDRTQGRDPYYAPAAAEDFDEPGGDAATETLERSLAMATSENLRDMLDNANAALNKMRKGTYGICDVCGKEIPKKRLDALPYATMCLNCRKRISLR
jgi:DnaK suppressor protein